MRKLLLTLILSLLPISPLFISSATAKTDNCKGNSECYSKSILSKSTMKDILLMYKNLEISTGNFNGKCNEVGREVGKQLYNKFKENSLKVYEITCGHSIMYGILEEYGKDTSFKPEKAISYCLKDENVPSCSFGVGLSLLKYDIINAYKICENGFMEYDRVSFKPKSFQMTARGDCFNGYIAKFFSNKSVDSVKNIKSLCIKLPSGYKDICEGSGGLILIQRNGLDRKSVESILISLKNECKDKKNFECMQFVGRNLDQALEFKLMINGIKEKKYYQYVINKICDKSEPCVEGFIQSHIMHRTHEEVYGICEGLILKKFCLKTAKEHI